MKQTICLVEDNADNRLLVHAILDDLYDVIEYCDGASALEGLKIVHPDVLALLNLTPEEGAGKKRFSFIQIAGGLSELERQSKLADAVESAVRTSFQRAVIKLRDDLVLYQSLQQSLVAPGDDHFLDQLGHFDATATAGLAASIIT